MIITAGPLQPPIYIWLDGIDVTDVTTRASVPDLELVEAPGWVDLVFVDVARSLEQRTTIWRSLPNGRPLIERRHGRILWTRKPINVILAGGPAVPDQSTYFDPPGAKPR